MIPVVGKTGRRVVVLAAVAAAVVTVVATLSVGLGNTADRHAAADQVVSVLPSAAPTDDATVDPDSDAAIDNAAPGPDVDTVGGAVAAVDGTLGLVPVAPAARAAVRGSRVRTAVEPVAPKPVPAPPSTTPTPTPPAPTTKTSTTKPAAGISCTAACAVLTGGRSASHSTSGNTRTSGSTKTSATKPKSD